MTPRGSELSWAGWWVPVPAPASAPAGTAPTWIAKAFGESASRWLARPLGQGKPLGRVELTVREFSEQIQSSRYYDAINPNVEAFRRRGGKLMLYQGLADALVPPSSTFEYYNALRDAMGGQRRTDRFARLFVVNGMNHCTGGPTPDSSAMILQMVRWVENGTAPESILATDRDGARTRPAFKYPLVAKYVGPDPAKDPTGPDKAENFVAAEPTVEHDDDVEWVGDYLLRPR